MRILSKRNNEEDKYSETNITELENSLEGRNSNFDQAKRVSKFIDTILKLLWQSRKKETIMKKNEESLGDL